MTSREARSCPFDNFVNFSPPFNILSRRVKALHTSCHYLQQPMAYCNSSLQSREDVFEFIIAAESASNRAARAEGACTAPQCALTRTNGGGASQLCRHWQQHSTVCMCMHEHVCVRNFLNIFFNRIVFFKGKLPEKCVMIRFVLGILFKQHQFYHKWSRNLFQ